MAINNWRKMDETSFNQWLRLLSKTAEAGTKLVDDIYDAQNSTSNTEQFSIDIWEARDPGRPFTIETPKGRLLKGILLDNNDIWEHLEFVDVKLWWDPITIPTGMLPEYLNLNSKIIRNKMNARLLAKQYSSWKNKKNINLWADEEKTIDDELDERYDTIKKEYLKMFKEYKQSRPDQQWEMAPKIAEAIIKYNLIK